MYLVAVLDWYSRYVLSWELSATLETEFCVLALDRALGAGVPEIFNTDQGSQFTSEDFTGPLKAAGIAISMDGRGRALDNVFVERLWRTVKYEDVYLRDYADFADAVSHLARYFRFTIASGCIKHWDTEHPSRCTGKQRERWNGAAWSDRVQPSTRPGGSKP